MHIRKSIIIYSDIYGQAVNLFLPILWLMRHWDILLWQLRISLLIKIKSWDVQTFHRAGISNISAIATQGSLSSELKSSSHRSDCIVSINLYFIPCCDCVVLLCAPLSSSVLYAACDTVSPVSPASVTRRGHRGPIRAQRSGGGGTHRVWGGMADKGCAARDGRECFIKVLNLTMNVSL